MVRSCALDSGTLTTDTELVRMSHCGGFYYNDRLRRKTQFKKATIYCIRFSDTSEVVYKPATTWTLAIHLHNIKTHSCTFCTY